MKLHLIFACGFGLIAQTIAAEPPRDLVKDFESLTLTRSWELGIWRVNNCAKHDEHAVNFRLSMTAQAFRYWLLMREGKIEPNLAHEAQIRRSFTTGELSVDTLKNPLARDKEGNGGFGVGRPVDSSTYKDLAEEFSRFVIAKAVTTDKKSE